MSTRIVACLGMLLLWSWAVTAAPVGTAFTYQGKLVESGQEADGTFDFEFSLFDAATDGGQVGPTITVSGLPVSAGDFVTQLDFGAAAFDGQQRWLQISVKGAGDVAYTLLTPRQQLTPAPYALRSVAAGIADGAVFADSAASADAVDYPDISNRPAGLDDGDDDVLGSLACSNGQVPIRSGASWACGDVDTDPGNELQDQFTTISTPAGTAPVADQPGDTLTLAAGPGVAVTGDAGSKTVTIGVAGNVVRTSASCGAGQLAAFDGSEWLCVDHPGLDDSQAARCVDRLGQLGVVIDGVCLLHRDNTASSIWNLAASTCALRGGDLCSPSQYSTLRNASPALFDPFYANRPVWSMDFSDDDADVKSDALRSADDPALSNQYSYGCCGPVLAEPSRSRATIVNGVMVTHARPAQDTTWPAAARICHSLGSDLCTKSQYVALNDAGRFPPNVARATRELSDNDGGLFSAVVGTNAPDNGLASDLWAFACCSTSRAAVDECESTDATVDGLCVAEIHDVEDTNFFDAARACTAQGADLCSHSQMQVLRNGGDFLGSSWTADGADNDSNRGAGLLPGQPDNPDPASTLMGYACCR